MKALSLLVILLVGVAFAGISPKTGPFVTVRVADRYGEVTVIDSVNIISVDGDVIRITRKGDFVGAWGVGKVEVVK